MTNSLIVPAHIIGRFQDVAAPSRLRSRPEIDIDTAAERFMSLLLWGLDENVSASRGGWPR